MELVSTARKLGLNPKNETNKEVGITSGYASDLLSDVLAHAKSGALWVTNHKHSNIIGVAVMLNLAGVVITGGIEPDPGTLQKAAEESVPLYTTDMSMFEVAGKLYEMGVRPC